MRNHYWTCSKFADWLRGTPSPGALTSRGWKEWKQEAKARHPVRYWLADEGLDYLQTVVFYIPDKLYALKYYVNNRFVTRTHALTAHPRDIAPGAWCDVGNRFLPCLFNELRDFVEVELAWWNIAWSNPKERAKYNAPFWATGWFRWRTWRCPESGLDNLAWQMTLTNEEFLDDDKKHLAEPTYQATKAQEILELYKWWTEVYPNRPDPYDAGGWSAYCEQRRQNGEDLLDFEDRTEEEREQTRQSLDATQAIEDKYNQEDEEMMIRLIRIRQSLWT
jgi:hypothetical protein